MSERVPFQYTVLRYVHDAVTGEFLNIGLAAYSPQQPYFKARLLPQYGRITQAFPTADGEFYRSYVGRLQTLLDKLAADVMSGQPSLLELGQRPDNITELLASVLPADDSAFQFGPSRGGVTDDLDDFFERMYARLVTQYVDKPTTASRNTEQFAQEVQMLLDTH